jgi:ATP-dependent protease ClpP protease subunit
MFGNRMSSTDFVSGREVRREVRLELLADAPCEVADSSALHIDLIGEIGADKPISLKNVAARLAYLGDDVMRVHVVINSEGGSPAEAFKIYDALRALPLDDSRTRQYRDRRRCDQAGCIRFH